MEILGIGPLEIILILLIALIVMGPKDMVKAGRTIGTLLRKIVKSPGWDTVKRTSKEIRYLPNRLMREAGIDEEEIRDIQRGFTLSDADRSILNPLSSSVKYLKPSNQEVPAQGSEVTQSDTPNSDAWTTGWDQVDPPSPPTPQASSPSDQS